MRSDGLNAIVSVPLVGILDSNTYVPLVTIGFYSFALPGAIASSLDVSCVGCGDDLSA